MKQNEQQTIYTSTEINHLSASAHETKPFEELADLPVTGEQEEQISGGTGNTYRGTTTVNNGILTVH